MFVGGVLYQGRYSTKKFGWGSITKKFGWKPVTKTFSWKSKLSQNHYNVVIKNNTKVVKFSAFFLVLFKNNIHQKKWPEASLIKKKFSNKPFLLSSFCMPKEKKVGFVPVIFWGIFEATTFRGNIYIKIVQVFLVPKEKKCCLMFRRQTFFEWFVPNYKFQ